MKDNERIYKEVEKTTEPEPQFESEQQRQAQKEFVANLLRGHKPAIDLEDVGMKLERYVLASLLRTSQQQLAYQLKPDDFTDASYSKIFTLFINRLDKGQKADATLLTDPALEKDEVIALSDSLFIDSTDDASVLQEKIDELCRLSDLRFLADKGRAACCFGQVGQVKLCQCCCGFFN